MFLRLFQLLAFVLVSVVFLPMVLCVNTFYSVWEKWFESITKS